MFGGEERGAVSVGRTCFLREFSAPPAVRMEKSSAMRSISTPKFSSAKARMRA
jgi:hypothetical protein